MSIQQSLRSHAEDGINPVTIKEHLLIAASTIDRLLQPAVGGYIPPEIASTSTAKADATREVIDADAVWNVPDEAIQKAWAENRLEIDLDDYGSPKLTADNVLRIYQSVVNHAFFIPPQAAT